MPTILYFRATAANCRLSLRCTRTTLFPNIRSSSYCIQQMQSAIKASYCILALMYISENVSACQNGLTSLARGIFARFFCYFHAFRRPWWNMALFTLILLHWQRRIRSHWGKTSFLVPKVNVEEIGIISSEYRRSRVILLVAAIQSWATRRSVMDYFPVIITKNAKQRRQAWLWSFVGWPWHSAFLRSRPILLTVEEEGLPSSSWQLQSLTQFPLWTIYRNPFFFYHNCRWTRRTWTIIISIKRW